MCPLFIYLFRFFLIFLIAIIIYLIALKLEEIVFLFLQGTALSLVLGSEAIGRIVSPIWCEYNYNQCL